MVYWTLTTVITGCIMNLPLPVSLMDWSPSKSSVMVMALAVLTSNSRFSFTSPDGISMGALRPAGVAMLAAQAGPADASSK
jgi:hypothetical protein